MRTNKQPKGLVCEADGGKTSPCRGLLYGIERRKQRSKRLRKQVVGQMPKLRKISQRKMSFVMGNQGHSQMSEPYHAISVLDSG